MSGLEVDFWPHAEAPEDRRGRRNLFQPPTRSGRTGSPFGLGICGAGSAMECDGLD